MLFLNAMFVFKRAVKSIKILGIALLVGVVFYNECFIYLIYSLSWPPPLCTGLNRPIRILIVANPLLMDSKAEEWTEVWDYDNYLRSTFIQALNHVQPHVVIFLGSLMRLGYNNSMNEFVPNYARFKAIYELDQPRFNMSIFIPGEYDVRYEDNSLLKRFKLHFRSTDVYQFGNVSFIQYNNYSKSHPYLRSSNSTKVVLSTYPLLGQRNLLGTEKVCYAYPNVILSAQGHSSEHRLGHRKTGDKWSVGLIKPPWKAKGMHKKYRIVRTAKSVSEFVVPSCSYNTEYDENGFGMLILDDISESMCYGVLWLPKRIFGIRMYIILTPLLLVTTALALLFTCLITPKTRKRKYMRRP